MPIPVLVSTSPLNTAIDVLIAANITFTFNTPLLASSVNEATCVLYRDDTGESIKVGVFLSANGLTITITPSVALREDVLYEAAIIGSASGMSGGNVKASDSVDLVADQSISFRTRIEPYMEITEIQSRAEIETIAPIRYDSDFAQNAGLLSITTTDPAGFQSGVSRDLSTITVTFAENVAQTGVATALELVLNNVMGLDEYYGEGVPWAVANTTGRYLHDWLHHTDVRQTEFDTDPSGLVTFDGDTVVWTKDPASPDFHYNTEVVVRVRSDSIVSAAGHILSEDAYFTFTTEYWPLYVNVQYIRLKLGMAVKTLFDDTIRRHIFQASVDAVDHAAGAFDLEHPYPAVRRYVRAASLIAVLDEAGILPILQGGQRKQLGDLSISFQAVDMSKLSALYKNATKELKASTIELRAYRRQGLPQWVVKGSENPYERADFFMRTWQHLRGTAQNSSNTSDRRAAKSELATDHPSINVIGYIEESAEQVEASAFPWWSIQ